MPRQSLHRIWSFFACLGAAAAVSTVSLGCDLFFARDHQLAPAAIDAAARGLSLVGGAKGGLAVYFDASGSMRGFALAAVANTRGAGDAYQSLLLGLRNIGEMSDAAATSPAAAGTPQARDAAKPSVQSFGSNLVSEPSLDTLVECALGRQDAPSAGSGLAGSADCPAGPRWNGAAISRTRIDGFFSQPTTCLDQVFGDILANGGTRLNIVVTDAEQNAPLDAEACPNARNLGTIQAYLNEWSEGGRFAAVLAASLPYQPWRTTSIQSYCGCTDHLLFVYLLAPSADAAEGAFDTLKTYWKDNGRALTYVPLVPRPALSHSVRVVTAPGAQKPDLVFPTAAQAVDLNPAEIGRLPQVWIQLNGREGLVAFNIEKVAFNRSNLEGSPAIDWSRTPLDWTDPVPLDAEGKPAGRDLGDLTLVRINDPLENEAHPLAANVRVPRFLGQSAEPEREVKPVEAPSLRLRIRRKRDSVEGCQWFLIEARSPARGQVDQVLGTLAGFSSDVCLNWDAVREQVNAVFQSGPLMRVLLHIDY